MKLERWTVALLVAVAAAIPFAPTAQAHKCAAYHGCDANACVDGEDHNHTDMNTVGRDEHCESHRADPPPPEGSCDYFGFTWPKVVCNIIEGGSRPELVALSSADAEALAAAGLLV